ncbi:MAG: hypothetical protein V2A34_03020 [Lentisphaerota bacterium]
MKRFNLFLGLLGIFLFSVAVRSEEVTVFSAAEAGPDVWTWEGARLTEQDGGLLLGKDKGESCTVVLGDRFTYLPDGIVEFGVEHVVSGTYSIQVLAFKGGDYLGAIDLVKDSMFAGTKTIPLAKLKLPAETQFITFKIWISKDLGSSVLFKDIRYFIPVVQANILYDREISATTSGLVDQVTWTPGEKGGVLALLPGTSVGSIVFQDRIAKPARGKLLLKASEVKNGTLTVHVCAFDSAGEYLDSVEVIQRALSGMSADLGAIQWPNNTVSFQVKVWLGGGAGASAVIQRILILE